MNRRHGVTSTTFQKIIIDSGAVYKNFVSPSSLGTLLGATRGGNEFVIEQEIREMEVDGAKGMVKEGRRITRSTAVITANFLTVDPALLDIALPGSIAGTFPLTTTPVAATHDTVKRTLDIALSDYLTNVAIVGQMNTNLQPVVVIVKNVLGDGNFTYSFTDNDETVLTVQFTAHFDPASMDAEPWEVFNPR